MSRGYLDIANTDVYKPKLHIVSKVKVDLAVILSLCSLNPWFIWDLPIERLFSPLFILICLCDLRRNSCTNKQVYTSLFFLICSFVFCKFFLSTPKREILYFLINYLPIVCVILFSKEEKRIFIKKVIKWVAIIFGVSLIGFIIKTIGINLPYREIDNPNPFYPAFNNYYIVLISKTNELDLFTRFSSIIIEPGHVGMTAAILLYINNYTLRDWKNIVFWVSLILSYSLAGYVLVLIGLVLYSVFKSQTLSKTLVKLFIFIIVLGAFTIVSYAYFSDSPIVNLIIMRLEYDPDKGISGNNRNSGNFNQNFETFLKSNDALLGMDGDKFVKVMYGTGNSSYKSFIMEKGLLSIVLLGAFGILYLIAYPSKFGFGLLVVLCCSFIQRPYFFWAIQSFPFVCMLPLYYSIKNQEMLLKKQIRKKLELSLDTLTSNNQYAKS